MAFMIFHLLELGFASAIFFNTLGIDKVLNGDKACPNAELPKR